MYAAGMLGVEKRRIYDITNALIGANVLQKQGKSSYHWMYPLFVLCFAVAALFPPRATKSSVPYHQGEISSKNSVRNLIKSSKNSLPTLKTPLSCPLFSILVL